MGFDLKRSHFSIQLEKEVVSGVEISEEGLLLASVLDAATGTEKVQPTTGSGDVIAGFAVRDNADHATTSEVESVTVPSAAPYQVQLRNNNLVAGTPGDGSTAALSAIRDNGTAMTLADDTSAGANSVGVDDVTGLLDFDAARAGETVSVTYRYNLTVAESRLKFFQRNINNEASTLFGQVGVGHGHGEIFTDMFDASVDWSAATAIKAGANGIVEDQSGSGVTLDARVISVPNVNNPLLGLAFNIGGATS